MSKNNTSGLQERKNHPTGTLKAKVFQNSLFFPKVFSSPLYSEAKVF
jgi:hypothetical protein